VGSSDYRCDYRRVHWRSKSVLWEYRLGGRVGHVSRRRFTAWRDGVALVNVDVKAALLELLFNVEFAGLLEWEERVTHPGDLVAGHVGLGNVDGGASEMGAGDVALGCSGVAVHPLKLFLVVNGADGGADFKRAMKESSMLAGQIGEELRGPGAAVAVRFREVLVDREVSRSGEGDEEVVSDAVLQIVLVLDALESVFALRSFILALERGMGAEQRRRQAEVTAMQRDGFGLGGGRQGKFAGPFTLAGAQSAAAAEDGTAGLGRVVARCPADCSAGGVAAGCRLAACIETTRCAAGKRRGRKPVSGLASAG